MVGWNHGFNGHEFGQTAGEWRTEEPGVLRSVGWKRVRHNLVTEQQQTKILPWPCWCHATR